MSKRFLPLIAALAALFFASCHKEGDYYHGDDITRGYYPMGFGHYITYDVDSVLYDNFTGDSIKRHWQVRYTILDTFYDNQNRNSYHTMIQKRTHDLVPWESNDVMYATPTRMGLDIVQGNIRVEKMVFPVSDGVTWKGNSQVAVSDQDLKYMADWNFKYSNMNKPYNNGRAEFGNTVTVDQIDYSLNVPIVPGVLSERIYGREVYAYNVGLVYREAVYWEYQPTTLGRKGWHVIMRAVDHN